MTEEKILELAREMTKEMRDPDFWQECPTCAATGIADDGDICPDCDGEGELEI